ncbi:MAG TPA: hypothetical protein VLF88_00925 [Candidatus Babeliales bacterium]|nr:hypothetical protein [Candidatus Babeliales bacterium]
MQTEENSAKDSETKPVMPNSVNWRRPIIIIPTIILAVLILAGIGAYYLVSGDTSKTTTAGTSIVKKVGKDKGKSYCIDGSKTIHTPQNNFFGPGNILITSYADQLVQKGFFWTTSDQKFTDNSSGSGQIKHTITKNSCPS